jgi:hypothetical protein
MITNPLAIRFSDEALRPIALELRAIYHKLQDIDAAWQSGQLINQYFTGAHLGETIQDDHPEYARNARTGNDATLLMAQIEAHLNQFNQAGVMDVVNGWCDRFA